MVRMSPPSGLQRHALFPHAAHPLTLVMRKDGVGLFVGRGDGLELGLAEGAFVGLSVGLDGLALGLVLGLVVGGHVAAAAFISQKYTEGNDMYPASPAPPQIPILPAVAVH